MLSFQKYIFKSFDGVEKCEPENKKTDLTQRNLMLASAGANRQQQGLSCMPLLLILPIKTNGVAKPTMKGKRLVQLPKSECMNLAEQLC